MDDFLDINKDWFLKKYIVLTPKRFWTMKIALNWLMQNKGENIVETGTTRILNDWGAGCSTVLFGEFVHRYQKNLWTVDISEENLKVAKEATLEYKKRIVYCQDDSVHFLNNFKSDIDLLYLDSVDCDPALLADNREAQNHALEEIKAAYEVLSLRACVLLDDNYFENGGKTKLAKEFLRSRNWICLMDYYQSLWVRG